MTFKDNFVVCIKSDGKILREKGEYVNLPFNSEYSILLKNLDSRKAAVSIEIDGQDVLDGDRLIVEPNSDIELEGFKKGNKVTNKFKFVKKTDKISDYRKDRIDDGFIRVEVTYEEEMSYSWYSWYYCDPRYCRYWLPYLNNIDYKDGASNIYFNSYSSQCSFIDGVKNECKTKSLEFSNNPEDLGITVKGDNSDQKFKKGYVKKLESNSSVIIIRLKGISGNKEIKKPLFVNSKLRCDVCGKICKSNDKYCSYCGNCLK